ncbi:hypothetical protein [Specibacter cremeus]|uniref:hypothetical protein n=1 Tax=Specibacter cremeus TaxID=1629051 RepID=UPI000F79B599|nr:hypothetical protein [Specibacter cremeus]
MDSGTVILVIALVIIALVVGGIVTVAVLVSRGVVGLVRWSKPGLERAKFEALKVRAQSGTGPSSALMGLRIHLREALEATARSLDVANSAQQYTGNLEPIVRTLQQAGAAIEQQLVVAQKDPDPAIQTMYAQTLGAHVKQIMTTAAGVRNALAATARPLTDVDLAAVTRKLDIEAQMLRNWSQTYTELGNDGPPA